MFYLHIKCITTNTLIKLSSRKSIDFIRNIIGSVADEKRRTFTTVLQYIFFLKIGLNY